MNDAGQPAGTEEPAGTGRSDHPSRRAPSGAWIAGSILAFVVGSLVIVYAIATTAAPTVEQRATVQGLAAAFVTGGLIAVLVPATAIVSLVIAAKRGRTGAAAGIAVCGALGAVAMLTMVPFALLSVGEAQADAARRAAPPTALETSRTPEQAGPDSSSWEDGSSTRSDTRHRPTTRSASTSGRVGSTTPTTASWSTTPGVVPAPTTRLGRPSRRRLPSHRRSGSCRPRASRSAPGSWAGAS